VTDYSLQQAQCLSESLQSSAPESPRFRAPSKREVKLFLSTPQINEILRLNVNLLRRRFNAEVSDSNLNLSPSDGISTLLRSYLAPGREIVFSSEFEDYTGGSLVAGRATSVRQVLRKVPDKNGRLTRHVIQA
jgi:hypothetical protein